MSLIKDPSGSFYLDDNQFNVNYIENSVKLKNDGGGGAEYMAGEGIKISENTISIDEAKIPTITTMNKKFSEVEADITNINNEFDNYLSLNGGTMRADATITATDSFIITSTSGNSTCSFGLSAAGADVLNTGNGITSSIRATDGGVEVKADTVTISITSDGMDLGGATLNHVGSISGNSMEIAVQSEVDFNNHKITNLGAPTEANDAMNKATADATYATKTEIANFITNDEFPAAATMSVAGIVKQAEAVNDATDDAIKTINELLANLRKAGILYETR